MTAPVRKPTEPPRSPERRNLAAAIASHNAASARLERIEEVRARLDDEFYEKHQPALRAAMDALTEAKANAPQRFVDEFLNEPQSDDTPSVADAEATLARAEEAVMRARTAREMLREEAAAAEATLRSRERELESAVYAVVFTDPRKIALVDEFQRTIRRALRLARAMRTIRVNVNGPISDPVSGLSTVVRIGDIAKSGMDGTLFTEEPSWRAAVAQLRSDPDAQLPDLPPLEPHDADDGVTKAA